MRNCPTAEKSLTHTAIKAMAVSAGHLPIYVGAVLPQQVGQFRISTDSVAQLFVGNASNHPDRPQKYPMPAATLYMDPL